jgi:hypothetical protein
VTLPHAALSGTIRALKFEIEGEITNVQVIAAGLGVRLRSHLKKTYGRGRWRKLKGIATVRVSNGLLRKAELHWYEAHGIGKRGIKIKHFLDEK